MKTRNRTPIAPLTRFNRFTTTGVWKRVKESAKTTKRVYECRCDCGKMCWVTGTRLRQGVIKSCGCFAREVTSRRMTRHGLSSTPTHNAWLSMLNRCHKPNHATYHYYGGRGIRVCKRWHVFEHFIEDMGLRPSPELTLERRNNDGPYCKANCYWASRQQQVSNTRRNVFVKLGPEIVTASEAARRFGLAPYRVLWRLRAGWDLKRALSSVLTQFGKKRKASVEAIEEEA